MLKSQESRRVAIVIEIFAASGEKGYSRFRSIAEVFAKAGYCVDVLCSNFIHADKSHRDPALIDRMDLPYSVIEFPEPGYCKNISVKRIYSQLVFARNLKRYFAEHDGAYDCVYSTMPDNYVAKVATDYAKRNSIPIVIDVEDLLPEGFKQVFDFPVVSDILYTPWYFTAESVYRRVDAVVGSSDEYRDRPFAHTSADRPKETVYVGIDLDEFDKGAIEKKSAFEKPEGEFWVAYTGTLGISYDLETPIRAMGLLQEKGLVDIVLKIAGDGPLRGELQKLAASMGVRVDFLGYLDYASMAALLCASDVAINSFGPKAPQSIVNKVGDYFGGGCSVVNTCSSAEFQKIIAENNVGINATPGDAREVATAIEMLYRNKGLCLAMGANARELAEVRFDRAVSYGRIVSLVDSLLNESRV